MRALISLSCLILACAACKGRNDAENRAAKQRFLKAEAAAPGDFAAGTGAKGGARSTEAIDVHQAMADPSEMEKAHLQGADSAARLLGGFRYSGKSDFVASRARTKHRLQETLEWIQSPKGDFRTRTDNNHGYGVETWWVGKKFFLRRRYGKVRERPVEGREHHKYREDVFGAWSAIYRSYRGRLKFTRGGETTVGGRRSVRFEVSLAPAPLTQLAASLPPHPERVDLGDLKVATATRKLWRAASRPVAATGSVELDAQTAVVLAVDFRGRLEIPAGKSDEPGEIVLGLVARMSDIGKDTVVRGPENTRVEPLMRKVEAKRFELIDMMRIEDFLIDKWEFPNERGAAVKVGVSLRAARDACRAVGKRLCQLKEWQKACHSDRPRNRYPYGRLYNPERCNTEEGGVKAAGERKECRGELEVFDLVGNAAEWVETKVKKTDAKTWCVAGGSYDDKDKARCLRCVPRDDVKDTSKVGFRCCK